MGKWDVPMFMLTFVKELDLDTSRLALQHGSAKDHMLEVVRTSYERALKCKRELASSLDLPLKSKDLASGSRSKLKNKPMAKYIVAETPSSLKSKEHEVSLIRRKSFRSKAVHDTLSLGRSQEASPEDGGSAQKKARTGDLASSTEVVFVVSMKAPIRKLRRLAANGQFKPMGSWQSDSDSSSKSGEDAALSFLLGWQWRRKWKCSLLRMGSSAPFFCAWGVIDGRDCSTKVMSIAEEAQASTDLEARGNLEEVQASMLKVPGARKGGEDNARKELEVDSEDDDIDAKNEVCLTSGSTSCEVDCNYHVRAGILIVAIEAEGKILDYTSTLAHAKMDPKKKNDVVEDHFRGDEDQASEFQCLIICNESFRGEEIATELRLRARETKHIDLELKVEEREGYQQRYDERDKMLAKRDVRIQELCSQHSDLKKWLSLNPRGRNWQRPELSLTTSSS
ncbi:hypothetical protein ACFE04_021349 [Oxalis oulophora]